MGVPGGGGGWWGGWLCVRLVFGVWVVLARGLRGVNTTLPLRLFSKDNFEKTFSNCRSIQTNFSLY